MRMFAAILCVLAVLPLREALAQAYPARPVRLIVAAAPGGTSDVLGRLLAPRLGERLGQPIVVENRAGGAGSVAAAAVAAAPADGYTLMISNSQMVVQTAGYATGADAKAKLGYDPIRDFSPVALVSWGPVVLGVHESFPAKSVSELVAVVRKNPGKYAFSSCGTGTPIHLAGELLNLSAKIDMAHVSYRGCAPAMVDAVSGQVPIFFTVIQNALPFQKSGKVRILGVASTRRLALSPELPTIAEAGYPGYDASVWFGFLAPAGTPQPVVAKLAAEINAEAKAPEFAEKLRGMFMEPATATPAELTDIMRSELERWQRVVREAKLKIE